MIVNPNEVLDQIHSQYEKNENLRVTIITELSYRSLDSTYRSSDFPYIDTDELKMMLAGVISMTEGLKTQIAHISHGIWRNENVR